MNDNIVAVTPPDDVLQDGDRLLLVDLTEQQMAVLSKALNEIELFNGIIFYMWRQGDDPEWLLDKKQKSKLIIFNADSNDHITVGYMAAQPNSCYFGTLKNLSKANIYAIYDVAQVVDILEKKLS
jgi:hypothetical protein